jgi:hypothetical protein
VTTVCGVYREESDTKTVQTIRNGHWIHDLGRSLVVKIDNREFMIES